MKTLTSLLITALLPVLGGTAHGATPAPVAAPADFAGAVPQPQGLAKEAVSQLRIRFPGGIVKNAVKGDAFRVSCSPEATGFQGWADNNTVWTYDFKAKSEDEDPRLVGGTRCEITQQQELASVDGKKWAAGSIHYTVTMAGPNVTEASAAHGFKGTLRETDPVVLITFDGPVNRAAFFSEQNGFLSYLSANAPAEKLALVPVPADQEKKIYALFNGGRATDEELARKNWVLASVKQNLIPGAQVQLTVQNQTSAANVDVRADKKFTQEFSVRSQFQADVQCAEPSAKSGACLPHSDIGVVMNGQVKWSDVKDAYIEYLPYKATDGKLVRSYPELQKLDDDTFWNRFFNAAGSYIPYLAKYSDTVVDNINFKVDIEPQTVAKVVLPAGLNDIDGRRLANAIAEFHVRISAASEVIHMPQSMSFFEKNVPNLYLPVGVVNLNQRLLIRKSGTDQKEWAPIRDVPTMIRMIRAYEARGEYRETPDYQTPLKDLGISSTVVEQRMTGKKNHSSYLQFPFGKATDGTIGGFYAIEVSSPTYEASQSDVKHNNYINPKYVLAQVTDLAVHLKKGKKQTVAWVTRLSEAQPVAGADVEIYNCLGQSVKTLKADANGLVSFPNQKFTENCQAGQDQYNSYLMPESFYVVARAGGDLSLTHSSWTSSNSYAMGAPGIGYFSSNVMDGDAHYHAVIGVNLVKPGQNVPIEIIAKLPVAKGFAEIRQDKLPTKALVVNSDDDKLFYEFPLAWKNGVADFTWQVPGADSAKIGRYTIKLQGGGETKYGTTIDSDVEVAEFKVPLMSGVIAFPTQSLVQPDNIPVNAVVRYANGVGAKNLAADLSYYFEPTSISRKKFADFSFGSGPMQLVDEGETDGNHGLPNSGRPVTLAGLTSGADGSFQKDIAAEKLPDGRSVAEVLKAVDRPQRLVVRLRYQDQIGEYQTLSQSKDIFNSRYYVGTALTSGTRSDAKLRAVVTDADKKTMTDLADLDMKVVRVETKVIGEELFGGLIKNTLERSLKPVRWAAQPQCKLEKGVASCPVGALKAGNYAFEVTTKSSRQTAHTLFKVDDDGRVYGENDYYQFGDEDGNKQLPLALNKKHFKDGEKAIVSFPAPFKTCRALVTLERSDVIQSFVVPNACEKGNVEVPVNADMAPNAFVSVYAITGRAENTSAKFGEVDLGRPTYKLGFANIKVNWSKFRSNVTVKTDKEKYQPGETVQVQVDVKPEEGALSNGTVTLVAIEEKILELKKNDTYAILDALMQLRPHDVTTVTPLERVETVSKENADMPTRAGARKGGDEGGDGSSKSEFKRKLFNALVTFQPGVPVVNGQAKFSFKTNDSLTRFKVFAVSQDAAQKFGTGEAIYLTEKDTQSYSNIPSVAHTGDSFPVKVTIQNNGKESASFRAEVTATVKDASGKVIATRTLTKTVSIGNATSQTVDVGQMNIEDNAARIEYSVHVYDSNGKLVDAMEPDAQNVLAAVPLAIHDSFLVQMDERDFSQELTKEPTALAGQGQIRVSVSKSLVGTALTQIVRRMDNDLFTDLLVGPKLDHALLKGSTANPGDVKAILEGVLANLDGEGFAKSYPQAKIGSVWLTAKILIELQQEPWAMKLAPPALLERMQNAVSSVVTRSVDPEYVGKDRMSWMRAQTLMGRAAFAYQDENLRSAARGVLMQLTADLDKNPKALGPSIDQWSNGDLLNLWLLQVVADSKNALTSPVLAQLMGPARLVYAGNSARLNGKPSFGWCYSDETIETAQLLQGLSQLRGQKDLARALSIGLVNSGDKNWYGNTTLMNVAEGLKTFARGYESAQVAGSALVAVKETDKSATVDWSKSSSSELVSNWPDAKATVQVTHAGEGRPWVGIQAFSAVPLTDARSQGLSVEKTIKNLSRDSGFQAGDIVEVSLTIRAGTLVRNVAINDPIPAGSNILAEAYGAQDSGQKTYAGYQLFFESVSQTASTVKYQYQLNNPGTFKLPPTRAEGLYMPSVFGEVPNATMKVQ